MILIYDQELTASRGLRLPAPQQTEVQPSHNHELASTSLADGVKAMPETNSDNGCTRTTSPSIQHDRSVLPSLQGCNTKTSVRGLLSEWVIITGNSTPRSNDMAEFATYLLDLIKVRRLDIVWANLRHFRRLISELDMWHRNFDVLLEIIQVRTFVEFFH